MQAYKTCAIFEAGTMAFHLKIPQISVFIFYSVDGRRMTYKSEVLV